MSHRNQRYKSPFRAQEAQGWLISPWWCKCLLSQGYWVGKEKWLEGLTDSSHLFKMCLRGKKPRALHWRGKIPFKRQTVYNLSPHFGSKTRMGRHTVSSACVMTMLVTHQYEWFSLVSSWLLDKASLISCGIFLRSVIIWWYCIVSMNFSKLFLWEGMAQGANIPMN